jgi:hypothetical protein
LESGDTASGGWDVTSDAVMAGLETLGWSVGWAVGGDGFVALAFRGDRRVAAADIDPERAWRDVWQSVTAPADGRSVNDTDWAYGGATPVGNQDGCHPGGSPP